jgi:hypothetical protein
MTDIEIKKGDKVWVQPIDALNSPELFDEEGNEYRLLRYFSLIVAKRKEAIIPLNGRILMSNVYSSKYSPVGLELVRKTNLEIGLAKIEYIGTPNKYYCYGKYKKNLDEGVNVSPGQIVVLHLINRNENILSRNYLEEETFAMFDRRKSYFYEQRRGILGVLYDKYKIK